MIPSENGLSEEASVTLVASDEETPIGAAMAPWSSYVDWTVETWFVCTIHASRAIQVQVVGCSLNDGIQGGSDRQRVKTGLTLAVPDEEQSTSSL